MLSLREAATRFGVNRKTLAAAAEAGVVSCARNAHGWPRFDAAELERQLAALPECLASDCTVRSLGPSGYCAKHAHIAAAGESLRASRVPEDERDYLTFDECLRAADIDWLTLDRAVRRGELVDCRIGHCRTITKADFHTWLAARSAEHGAYFAFCSNRGLDPTQGASKSQYADKLARDNGRLTTPELRKQLGGVAGSTATRRVRIGRLRAVEVRVYGVTFFQYASADVRDHRREHWELAKHDGRRMAWLDPRHAPRLERRRVERLTLILGTRSAAVGAVRAMAEARRKAYSVTAGGARPTTKPERWARLQDRVRPELENERRVQLELGLGDDGPVSDYAVAIAIAEIDCEEHPDDWKQYREWDSEAKVWTLRASLARPAANRVLTALRRRKKSLQIAYTKSRAA